ncbi:MAG: hypothetical protein ACT4PV_13450 [Planctomycetaceae bacterium]
MRLLLLLPLAAACASTGGSLEEGDRPIIVRVVARQYYAGSPTIAVENLAGRDLVELRSRRLAPGEEPIAYVEDAVLRALLRELDRNGFARHGAARPPDPGALGARAEVAVVRQNGEPRAFLRRAGQGNDAARAFQACLQAVVQVYDATPKLQASASGADKFGVRKARVGS